MDQLKPNAIYVYERADGIYEFLNQQCREAARCIKGVIPPMSTRDLRDLVWTSQYPKQGHYPVVLIRGEVGRMAANAERLMFNMRHGVIESAVGCGLERECNTLFNAAYKAAYEAKLCGEVLTIDSFKDAPTSGTTRPLGSERVALAAE